MICLNTCLIWSLTLPYLECSKLSNFRKGEAWIVVIPKKIVVKVKLKQVGLETFQHVHVEAADGIAGKIHLRTLWDVVSLTSIDTQPAHTCF